MLRSHSDVIGTSECKRRRRITTTSHSRRRNVRDLNLRYDTIRYDRRV